MLTGVATDHLIDYLSNREPSKIVRNPGLDLVELASGLEKSNPRWKRAIQVNLHEQIIRNTEAKFYTPFFIRSTDSHKDLWLIHRKASPNPFSRFSYPLDRVIGFGYKRCRYGRYACRSTSGHRAD